MKYNKVLFLNILQFAMSVTLPPLPYSYSALEPHISEKTLQFHHDKHHKKYVDTTNDLSKFFK
jgi:Fe-Mn family superoxide dismutase